jgi:NADPH-dependent 7-cyano-7-deazaguanine reductase QueF-like protein
MKTAVIALIQDVAKGPRHLEALPMPFANADSVRAYAVNWLNEKVTVVVRTIEVEVDDDVLVRTFM